MHNNLPQSTIKQIQMANNFLSSMEPAIRQAHQSARALEAVGSVFQMRSAVSAIAPALELARENNYRYTSAVSQAVKSLNLAPALQLASLGQQHKITLMALQSSLSVPPNRLLPDQSFLNQLKAIQTIAAQAVTPPIEITRKIELPLVSYPEGAVYSWIERETYASPNPSTSGDVFVYRDISEVLDSHKQEATTPAECEFINDVKSWVKDPKNLMIVLATVNIAVNLANHFFSRYDLEQAKFYISLAADILEVLMLFFKRIN